MPSSSCWFSRSERRARHSSPAQPRHRGGGDQREALERPVERPRAAEQQGLAGKPDHQGERQPGGRAHDPAAAEPGGRHDAS
jgi:hypothetical protein